MKLGNTTLERVVREGIDADTEEYLNEVGIDGAAAGVACGQLAVAGVESLGFERPSADSPLFLSPREVGPALTTAALCGFELGVRAMCELARAQEPCGHDGWTEGCARCEANMDTALKAMES